MGAIRKEVRENYLCDHLDDEAILIPFLNGFFVTWARLRKVYNTHLKVFFLSPEKHMKEAYGFENEVMLVYAPYKRMEPRTLQAVEQIFSESPAKGRVETLNYFLVSDADNVQSWLESYTSSRQESRIIVAFTRKELEQNRGNSWFIRNKLNQQFFGRDLFNYSLPLVEDTYFFGRQPLLMDFYDTIKRKENKAIFGLRKTGKTSFLFKLCRLLKAEQIAIPIYIDCKQPDIRKSRWFELLQGLANEISKNLDIKYNEEYNERNASKEFLELVIKAKEKNKQLCLIFDEIEFISFVAKLDKHWQDDFIEFWQTMWSCQSQSKNFSFILSGVNPSVVETDVVNEIQNPLFGIVSHRYLTGFTEDETRIMIKTLSKRMGLKFSYNAISAIHKWYGGHPLLIRLACSWLNTILSVDHNKPIEINTATFELNKEECDNELVFYCGHVVSEMKQFYPDEYFMLELFASKQLIDFKELAEDETNIRHLKNYGIIGEKNGEFYSKIPVVTKYIGIELARKDNRQLIYKIISSKNRAKWLRRRLEEIIIDIRVLEKIIRKNNLTELFGVASFPEADQFKNLGVVNSKGDFTVFINTCYRCFVESIDRYGRTIGKKKYFWEDIKSAYPSLFYVLLKIRVYRHDCDHLELNEKSYEVGIKENS